MDTEKLNKKLAEWAGFKQLPKGKRGFHFERTEKIMNWMPPDAKEWWQSRAFIPNFTQSLDACFKWLVPKLHWVSIGSRADTNIKGARKKKLYEVVVQRKLGNRPKTAIDKEPALALCLAIEKLINERND